MADKSSFFRAPLFIALSALLVVQAGAYYSLPTAETAPHAPPLSGFPMTANDWTMMSESKIEDEVLAVLRADDTMSRTYRSDSSRTVASLFIAYFHSQKSGAAPHSPKNCLPGSGWAPIASGTVDVDIPGQSSPMTINRFVVGKGTERTLVLYWYQTAHRVVASEYMAKIWLVLDSVRYRRSDTAIVRVVVPMPPDDPARAEGAALDFVRAIAAPVSAIFPS